MVYMMITKEQVRAGRAFLDWDREQLSAESGVSVAQIANLETGKTENPRMGTMQAISNAFLRHYIVFENGGVFKRQDLTLVIDGEGWYQKLLDDVYLTLLDKPVAEYLTLCGDDRVSSPEVINHIRKLRNAGIGMRQVVEAGNTYLMGAVKEYRYLPKKNFINHVTLIYGDKVAICGGKATVFLDAHLAATWRNIFNYLWDTLPQPEKSHAKERY